MLKKESHFTLDLVGKGVLSVLVGVRPNAILADFLELTRIRYALYMRLSCRMTPLA